VFQDLEKEIGVSNVFSPSPTDPQHTRRSKTRYKNQADVNIVRPPKEERDRKAAEKKAYIARRSANGSDDDAEGEEE
jgi:hypothetical protein